MAYAKKQLTATAPFNLLRGSLVVKVCFSFDADSVHVLHLPWPAFMSVEGSLVTKLVSRTRGRQQILFLTCFAGSQWQSQCPFGKPWLHI